MVIIKKNNLSPLKWRLERIVTIHPEKDDVTRVAIIRVAKGTTRIAVAKLCPLPIE